MSFVSSFPIFLSFLFSCSTAPAAALSQCWTEIVSRVPFALFLTFAGARLMFRYWNWSSAVNFWKICSVRVRKIPSILNCQGLDFTVSGCWILSIAFLLLLRWFCFLSFNVLLRQMTSKGFSRVKPPLYLSLASIHPCRAGFFFFFNAFLDSICGVSYLLLRKQVNPRQSRIKH